MIEHDIGRYERTNNEAVSDESVRWLDAALSETHHRTSSHLTHYIVSTRFVEERLLRVTVLRRALRPLPGRHRRMGRYRYRPDAIVAIVREFVEETGYRATVDALLGVDSRSVPADQSAAGVLHHNVGIFYRVRITGGTLRPEQRDGLRVECSWVPVDEITSLPRSSLVDIGLALARTTPPSGHVAPIPVGGLIRH